MLDYLDKFFPEFVERVRRMPPLARLVAVMAIAAMPIAAVVAYRARSRVLSLLGRQLTLPVYAIVLLFIGAGLVVLVVIRIRQVNRARSLLTRFFLAWMDFTSFFQPFQARIEAWLQPLPEDMRRQLWDDIANDLPAFHEQRAELRRLLFLLGEPALAIRTNEHWEHLKLEYAGLPLKNYHTPFSYLLDIRNPIAAVNHEATPISASLQLTGDDLEYLTYAHPHLRRIWASRHNVRASLGRA